ncbi:hypothetical protein COJ23_22245 [Priestia megaterium]|uniref:alpha/beta hydrolase n=1 Tax=Priestia megaterium TaxID=1404 RepID=UPI000BF44C09|nr:alpha/beta hydrolase [Priestia megaterium]PFK46727.1 hypothetical protein COJ23_22245 [Priestia megaterium]
MGYSRDIYHDLNERYERSIRGDVVIICISGRGGVGSPSGMVDLRDKLRNALTPLGVIPDNIFHRSWNHGESDNPFGAPWVSDLNREIERRTSNPSYLAVIGHSYGGWAACRLSNATKRIPDFVGLIDPVFGPSNTFVEGDRPRGQLIKNWYQNNSIVGGDPCTGWGKAPCGPTSNGISCGYKSVPGAHENIKEEFDKTWEGNRKRARCPWGRVHILTSHVTLDDNQWIQRQIYDKLVSDIGRIYPSTLNVGQRFRATNDYAVKNGYVGGFPNFHQADYGQGVVNGTMLLKQGTAEWRDVPVVELGNPPSDDIGQRFRATNDYAVKNGYVGGFPNFHQADYGQGVVNGTILLKQGTAEWRDVPVVELGNPPSDDIGQRFRATNDYAVKNGYVGGFPNFHQADYGQGVVNGTILLKQGTAEWRDVYVCKDLGLDCP